MDNDTYTFSVLIDHFHLTPTEIGELTRKQIRDLYFAKRNKDGGIEAPFGELPQKQPVKKITREQLIDLFKKQGIPLKVPKKHT